MNSKRRLAIACLVATSATFIAGCSRPPLVSNETVLPPDPPAHLLRAAPRPVVVSDVVTKQDRLRLVEALAAYGDSNASLIWSWCLWWQGQRAAFGKGGDPARCGPNPTPSAAAPAAAPE